MKIWQNIGCLIGCSWIMHFIIKSEHYWIAQIFGTVGLGMIIYMTLDAFSPEEDTLVTIMEYQIKTIKERLDYLKKVADHFNMHNESKSNCSEQCLAVYKKQQEHHESKQ